MSGEASGRVEQLCGRVAGAENFEGNARPGGLRAHRYLKEDYEWIKNTHNCARHNL